ncbi:MAG: major capsid protein [Microviridae sp.]|nr:MAG: major capsid protein [Microviridae sp.]
MFRQNTYNEGSYYTLCPLARQDVVPGQSVAIDLDMVMESDAFLQNVLNGGQASIYAFYTPHRLVWDEWVDFATDPQTSLTIPSTSVVAASLFDQGPTAISALPRRAFKLIYNQYFGSEQFGFYYADITDDAAVNRLPLRTNDQLIGRIFPGAGAPDVPYNVPVTGISGSTGSGTIQLNDFRRALNSAKSIRRSNLTGDKYVDAMARMGVNLNWAIQMAPELLGQTSWDFEAKETRASYTPADPAPVGSSSTGRAYARYSEKRKFKTARKYFAEHGTIWVLLAVRPWAFQANYTGPQSAFQLQRSQQFWGDNQAGVQNAPVSQVGGSGAAEVFQSRFDWLLAGQNMVGDASSVPWITKVTAPTAGVGPLVYPALAIADDATLDARFATYTRYRGMGPTPVKAGVI